MSPPRSTLCGCSVAVHACTCHRCGVDTSSPASAGMQATRASNTCKQHVQATRASNTCKQHMQATHASNTCKQHMQATFFLAMPATLSLQVCAPCVERLWTSSARHATRRGQGGRGHTLEAAKLCLLAVTHSGSFDDQIWSQLVRNLQPHVLRVSPACARQHACARMHARSRAVQLHENAAGCVRKDFRKGNQRAPGSDVRERFARSAVHAALHFKREAAGGG